MFSNGSTAVWSDPRTAHSRRWTGLSDGLLNWIHAWLEFGGIDDSPDAWVFPSERLMTPLSKDNCWRRHFLPRLKPVGLEWANFQVMRRTHATLGDGLGIDSLVRADQMSHTLDVQPERIYEGIPRTPEGSRNSTRESDWRNLIEAFWSRA